MCYSCKVRCHIIKRLLVVSVAIAELSSCRRATPTSHDPSPAKDMSTTHDVSVKDQIQRSEQEAMERDAARVCDRPTAMYEGSIAVDRSDYVHSVARGKDFVDEPVDGLDAIVSKSTRVRFTLHYPFERPFAGVVMGQITLRRTVDAIRAAFRQMYQGTTEREIPGMHNKEVTGPLGRAFHVIDDLFIESIELCADDTLLIGIGS